MKIVVSYARQDFDIVREIVKVLSKEPLLVWWDQNLTPGDEFARRIEQQIEACKCLLVVWSPHSVESQWVRKEVSFAGNSNKPVIHVRINDVKLPLLYDNMHGQQLEVKDGKCVDVSKLNDIASACKAAIGVKGPKEVILEANIAKKGWEFDALAIATPVPGMDIYLSFRPCGKNGVFLLMCSDSTDGWVADGIPTAKDRHQKLLKMTERGSGDGARSYKDRGKNYLKVKNDVLFIMDPLRPYGIQIGGLRSARPHAHPGAIRGDFSFNELRWLPAEGESNEWIYMTLAEILTQEETLQKLYDVLPSRFIKDEDMANRIRELIAKNPFSPLKLQEGMCLFCKDAFKKHRLLSTAKQEQEHKAFIIANDYPFGPSFHYLAITSEPVHSWERLTYKQIRGINLLLWEFLSDKKNTYGAAGISFGFNSTVRHLVLGSKTQSSAGASIQHVHKQAWGMPSNGANIAERLIEVSQAYWNHGVDYQKAYCSALKEAGYVIWQDKRVALYVPYGQSSKSELQVMVLRPCGNIRDLEEEEVISLSKAEYIALRIFKKLGINSFNQVVLSKLLGDTRAPQFHLVVAFITRDVDLAVSELSMLFVVDQHPWDSRNEIDKHWNEIRGKVEAELEQG